MSYRVEPVMRIVPQRPVGPRRKGYYETKAAMEEQRDLVLRQERKDTLSRK